MQRLRKIVTALVAAMGIGGITHAAIDVCPIDGNTVTVVTRTRLPFVRIIGQREDGEDVLYLVRARDYTFERGEHWWEWSWVATIPVEPQWSLYTELCARQYDLWHRDWDEACAAVETCGEPGSLGIKPIRCELK